MLWPWLCCDCHLTAWWCISSFKNLVSIHLAESCHEAHYSSIFHAKQQTFFVCFLTVSTSHTRFSTFFTHWQYTPCRHHSQPIHRTFFACWLHVFLPADLSFLTLPWHSLPVDRCSQAEVTLRDLHRWDRLRGGQADQLTDSSLRQPDHQPAPLRDGWVRDSSGHWCH